MIQIDPEFRYHIIPQISKEEYSLLKKNILKNGCRDSIVTWTETLENGQPGRTIILDGHNRYEICKKYKIQFVRTEIILKNRDEAKVWVIQNQLGRRNLTSYQRMKLALLLKPSIEEKAKERMIAGKADPMQKSSQGKSRDELAKFAGVSHDTVHKVEIIEKEAPPEIKEAAEKGEISVNRAYKETKVFTGKTNKIKLGPPSNGTQFARIAIMNLEKITDDDLERDQAFDVVKQWIADIVAKKTPVIKQSKILSTLQYYFIRAGLGDKKKFRRWLRTQRN